MRPLLRPILLATMLLATASPPASAHVVLAERSAVSGAYYVATLRVPHGCAGSATIALRVTVPPDIVSARPMPKPGWQVQVIHEPLPQPVVVEGHTLTRRVKEIVWRDGHLPDEQFDEFSISVKLPDRVGPVYFPVVQTCERGHADWVELPPDGQGTQHLQYPAPAVILTPR